MRIEDIISKLIRDIESIWLEYSQNFLNELAYYPGCCSTPWNRSELALMKIYRDTLLEHQRQVRLVMPLCLSEEKVLSLTGNVRNLIGRHTCKFVPQTTTVDEDLIWKIDNPECVPYENWERCILIGCDIDFDVRFLLEARKTVNFQMSSILTPLKNLIDTCSLKLSIEITDYADCEVNYELYKEFTDCSLTYQSYQQIAQCGITYETMQELANCNVLLDFNYKTNCPEILLGINKYSVCDIGDIPITII